LRLPLAPSGNLPIESSTDVPPAASATAEKRSGAVTPKVCQKRRRREFGNEVADCFDLSKYFLYAIAVVLVVSLLCALESNLFTNFPFHFVLIAASPKVQPRRTAALAALLHHLPPPTLLDPPTVITLRLAVAHARKKPLQRAVAQCAELSLPMMLALVGTAIGVGQVVTARGATAEETAN